MQQRRVRLGDILDDYCPRERRITNHAVVAMIEDEVKQTRCTTCDADHEYKGGRAPASRRRKAEGVLVPPAETSRPELIAADALADSALEAEPLDEAVTAVTADAGSLVEAVDASEPAPAEMLAAEDAAEAAEEAPATAEDEWPVHRPLIRATLPRPEGHVPERKEPDFTMRSNRFDGQRNHRGFRAQRQAQGQFGGPRHGGGQGGERNGNRPPQGNQRSGRPGGQGQRHGGGPNRGPKRGR